MDPIIVVFLVSIGILALINIFYRFLINQKKAVQSKERVKELNKEMKKCMNDKPKMNSIYSEVMKEQGSIMKMSMKPMLISFVVVALLLPAIHTLYGDVTVTLPTGGFSNVTLSGVTYGLSMAENNSFTLIDYGTNVTPKILEFPSKIVLSENKYIVTKTDRINNLNQTDTTILFANIVAVAPFGIPFIGSAWSWIIWYILVSIPFMIIIRKLYGIKI
ncbi:MAG: EMC3/TMCO1 family protein [Candidatus Aenigmatarchaeota archaeon]